MTRWSNTASVVAGVTAGVLALGTMGGARATRSLHAATGGEQRVSPNEKVLRGRLLVLSHDCGGCHNGGSDPSSKDWLIGVNGPGQEFLIGPCRVDPAAKPCFHTRPRNLTPDNTTGLGRFSERQIFNALRYGLRPGETPDVEITSTTPGVGNFPAHPRYLAAPMPWPAWRHMPDDELWAIAAYLKQGVKPVHNRVEDSEGPPDFWASEYTPAKIGTYPAPPFPAASERMPMPAGQR